MTENSKAKTYEISIHKYKDKNKPFSDSDLTFLDLSRLKVFGMPSWIKLIKIYV